MPDSREPPGPPDELVGLRARVRELERIQHTALEGEESLRRVLQQMPFPVMVYAPDGTAQLVNQAFMRLFGFPPDAPIVGRYNVLTEPAIQALGLLPAAKRAFGGEIVFLPEIRVPGALLATAASGQTRELVFEATLFPVLSETGVVRNVVTFYKDITEPHRLAEEQRRLEQREVQNQKLESLGALAGGIAHEFNNLLTTVLGHASLARADAAPGSAIGSSLCEIEAAARRAAELTQQLLAYAGLGRLPVEFVRLDRLVEELAPQLDLVATGRIRLVREFAADLPVVEADTSQMRQLILHLVQNAAEAIGDLPGTIAVRLQARECAASTLATGASPDALPAGRYVSLEVSDTGVGVPDRTRDHMFDPFFSPWMTGRGLGLPAVLGIARGHRGTIQVEDNPGGGTIFRVLLPVPSHPAAAPAAPRPLASPGGPITVLVIDDETAVRELARRVLERQGLKVVLAADGLSGVRLFSEHPDDVQLVLMDLKLPDIGGEEVLQRLRAIRPAVRVLVTSGFSAQEAASRIRAEGLVGFLEKPFTYADLVRSVTDALSGTPVHART